MKTLYILRPLFLVILIFMTTSCKKDDDANNGCVKDENFFEATFNGENIEPHYAQGGGFGLYTLFLERCSTNEDNWLLSITTENGPNLYLNLIINNNVGIYSIETGDGNHIPIDCDEIFSLYLHDEFSNSYTYLSSDNGQVEIIEYESGPGKIVGTFTCIMTSTENPSMTHTITGQFNLNKSTLDNTKKPCWL